MNDIKLLNSQHTVSKCIYFLGSSENYSSNHIPFTLPNCHYCVVMYNACTTNSVNMMNDGLFAIHTAVVLCSENKIRMLREASSQYLPIWWNIYARVRTRSIIHRRYHHRYHSFHNLSIFYFHMISMSFCLVFLMFFFLCLSIFKRCELTCLKFLKFLHVVFTLLTFIFSQFQFVQIKSSFDVLFH